MMKIYQPSLFILLITAVVGFSFGSGLAQSYGDRPEDLSVNYHRTSGAVPAPYYHELTITVLPSGTGTIQLIPDYPSESVPKWTESFNVSASKLDEFYEQIASQEALTRTWQAPTKPSSESPDETIEIIANGRQMRIPSQIARGLRQQSRSKDNIAKAVQALVPDDLWQSLKERHKIYAKEHYPHGSQ
jgi:hypothetical protein